MLDLTDYSDLPLLVDPLVDEVPASPNDDIAKELLASLIATQGISATRAAKDISAIPAPKGRRPWRVRALVAAAAALVLFVGVLALPNGAGITPAEALQQANDLLQASTSGRSQMVGTRTTDRGPVSATTTWRWNGADEHSRTDSAGAVLSDTSPAPEEGEVFTPASYESFTVAGISVARINDEPFAELEPFGPTSEEQTRSIFERLTRLADLFDQCAENSPISAAVDGPRVISYCGAGTGAEFYRQFAQVAPEAVYSAGDAAVRIDLDDATGHVLGVVIQVADLALEPAATGMPVPDSPDPFLLISSNAETRITWHDLGADIDIVLPPLG